MKTAFLCVAGLLLACPAGPAQAPPADGNFPNPASLVSVLRQLEHSLNARNAPQVCAALPLLWRVRTPDGDYSISTTPLRSLLDRFSSTAHGDRIIDDRIVSDAQTWLEHLATQLDSYRSAAPPVNQAHARIERILAHPEFAANAPPNAWERFWARVGARTGRWIEGLFNFSRVHSTSSVVIFCLAVAGAVSLLAFFLFRLRRRQRYNFNLSGSPLPSLLRTSQAWLQAARAASNHGDLSTAIQCAYWAGIARLQESRALPESNTYTPREYLRLLSSPPQRLATSPAVGNDAGIIPLRTLTSYLERFWYARAAATAEDFSACLASLEALGCQVD